MEKISPFIKCVDYWPGRIPPEKLLIYRQMIDEGQIRKHHAVYNRTTGSSTVEYFSIAPHEWIRQQMHERCEQQIEMPL
jgi:hypothetical protein